jgi:hypothetical protein
VGTIALTLSAILALLLAVHRRPAPSRGDERRRTALILACLVALQALHFVEEYATHFYERFPVMVGLAPWPASFFIVFNLTWLIAWAVSVIGVRAGVTPAFFAAWFLAIAGMVNGVAHPLLALQAAGYFPGLITSPLVGINGVVLWKRLMLVTETRRW